MDEYSALPEYEQMRALKLFTDEEILRINKSRENFEYKISQPTKDKIKDFVEYIKYERSLMAKAKERIKDQKVTSSHSILTQIVDRMKKIYAQALSKPPITDKIRFWDEYIKFLQAFKYTKDISPTYDRMLQFHSDKQDVWVRAILWEYNENFNNERIKSLLMRAQSRHPESQKLYLTFFQIELENKCQLAALEALQHADIVYTSSKKKFSNIEFYVEMLNIVDKFSYASSIQQNILEDMREKFPREELLWHTLAQRELNGLSAVDCTVDFTGLIKTESAENKKEDSKLSLALLKKLKIEDLSSPPQHTLKKRIELCMQLYENAGRTINSCKMWNYYINAMLELNSDLSTQAATKRFALKRAFEEASKHEKMSEDHYIQYIQMLYTQSKDDPNINNVFEMATKAYNKSLQIWTLCMRYHLQKNDFKQIQAVFSKALFFLRDDCADLWQLYMIYLKSCRNTQAHAEFERRMSQLSGRSHPNFNVLKAQMLELLAATVSMKRARKTYELFIKDYPECYEVHEMMAELEAMQMKRDPQTERKCLENLIEQFGKTRTDVWLRYMRYERSVGTPKNVMGLHQRALETLNPKLLNDFSAQYNFFTNGVV